MRLRNIAGKTVIIYDDMIRLGGSVINAEKKMICTDSHANTQYFNDGFFEVRSLADLICEVI